MSAGKWSPFHTTLHTTQPRVDPALQPAAGRSAAGRQGPLLASRSALTGAGALPSIPQSRTGSMSGSASATSYHRRKEPTESSSLHLRAQVSGPDAKEWSTNCVSSTTHQAYGPVEIPRRKLPQPPAFAPEKISGLGWSVPGLSDTSSFVSAKERTIDKRSGDVGPRTSHATEMRAQKAEARNTTRHSPATWSTNNKTAYGSNPALLNELCLERVRELAHAKVARTVRSDRPNVI